MPIFLRNSDLDSRLQELAEGQPCPTTKHGMAEAILRRGLDAVDLTGNPEAWRTIGNPAPVSPTDGATNNGQAPLIPDARLTVAPATSKDDARTS